MDRSQPAHGGARTIARAPVAQDHLARGQAKQYKMPEMYWALEDARGPVVTMMPFGLADTLTSTLDYRTVPRLLWVYAKSAVRELSRGKI